MRQGKRSKQNLWLKVLQGDMRTVTHPARVRDCIRRHLDLPRQWRRVTHPARVRDCIAVHPEHRLVAVDTFLLSLGAFVGRSRACHLRLCSLNEAPPQFCLRFDGRHQCTLVGLGGSVFVNEDLIGEESVELRADDQIICDPYILKVVPQPTRETFQEMTGPGERETALSSISDAHFVLNLPHTGKDVMMPLNDSTVSSKTEQ